MKSLFKYIRVVTFYLVFATNTVAQNYVEDLKQYLNAYEQFDNRKMIVTVKTYTLPSDVKAKSTLQYTVFKKGALYCQKSILSTMAVVEGKSIMLDHSNKRMVYKIVDMSKLKDPKAQAMNFQLDSLVKDIHKYKITYLGVKAGTKLYAVENVDALIKTMHIGFDESTHKLKKMLYYYRANDYNESSKIEIDFEDKELVSADEAFLQEQTYFVSKNNVLEPALAYKGYKIVQTKE